MIKHKADQVLGSVNFLLITYDSCRWDTYHSAKTLKVDTFCKARKAYTQGTFTFAAHMAIYQGILPQVRARIPFYNRYSRQLIRIANRPTLVPSLITFTQGTVDIIRGFSANGYYTLGIGAVEWFKHPALTDPFEDFFFTGIHAHQQVCLFQENISEREPPFFSLINFGETHDPYEYTPAPVTYPRISRPRQLDGEPTEFDHDGFHRQIKCCEFLDKRVGEILTYLQGLERSTVVVLCGDHGECFGEDNLIGHGFYHPKVMEVPVAIFEVGRDHLSAAATTAV